MKKLMALLAAICLLSATSPAFALFTNGGFEDGTFNGWTVEYGYVNNYGGGTTTTASPIWGNSANPYGNVTPQIITAASVLPGQTLDVNPYVGDKMAKINDIYGNFNATKISQTATITAADLDETIYVDWGAMLVDPGHPFNDQPYFSIKVLKNGSVVDSFSANATNAAAPGSGWTSAGNYGGTLYYKAGQYSYDLSSFAEGDTITVSMFVTDCAQGAHGGYAFLDGLGTERIPPPDTVPEPGTVMLLGVGFLGLAAYGKRRKMRN